MNELKEQLDELADEIKVVDLRDRALATSRRIGVRRNVTLVVAGLALIAVAATTVLETTAKGDPWPTATQPTSPLPIAPEPIVLPESSLDEDRHEWDTALVANTFMTVPSWATPCVNGRISINESGHHVTTAAPSQNSASVRIEDVWQSDVDRDGMKDLVMRLTCDNFGSSLSQVVAFRRSGAELTPFGRVVGEQDGARVLSVEVTNQGRVKVLVYKGPGAPPNSVSQWRTYAWQSDRFRQVEGPVSFPSAVTSTASLAADSAVVTLSAADAGKYHGNLDISVLNSGNAGVSNARIRIALPLQIRPTGSGWGDCDQFLTPGMLEIDCRIGALAAGARRELRYEVMATARPETDGGLSRFNVHIAQLLPYTLEESTPLWAAIVVKLQ